MKLNKLLIGSLVALAVVLIPLTSISKENKAAADTVVLTNKNLLVLNTEVDGDSVGKLIMAAKKLDAELPAKEPIYLYLNTPGGSVTSGLELIEALKGLGRPVNTITEFAASMGFQIAQNLDTRLILKSGVLMSHRATGSFSGSFGGASPSQVDQRMHVWNQIMNELDQVVVDRSGGKLTLESYRKAYNNELWITGQESVSGGYADAITRVKCSKSLAGTTQHTTDFMGMTITYDLDDCPLNSAPLNVRISSIIPINPDYTNKVKSEFPSAFQTKANTPLPMQLF